MQEEKVLEQNPSIFSMLSCRIFMYEEDNRTVLATLKPATLLAKMFHTQQLPKADEQVENTIIATMQNIRLNLLFAFLYNSLAIPVAARVLYPFFGLLLSSTIAGAAVSLSSVPVIGNSLRIRTVKL